MYTPSFLLHARMLSKLHLASEKIRQKDMNKGEKFDPLAYLHTRLGNNMRSKERVLFPLRRLHEEFASLPGSLKILEYGTGPVIMNIISAAPHASEITLAEYNRGNRDVLHSWLEGTFHSFDWSPFFDHVVTDLEGKGAKEARARVALVRSVVKRVVWCDFTAPRIIQEGHEGPYDVVISPSCIDCCATLAQFRRNVENVSTFVKPGGTLMLYLSERNMHRESGTYYIGSTPHTLVNISASYVAEQLKNLGFSGVRSYSCPGDPEAMKKLQDEDMLGYMFLTGVMGT